MPAIMFHPSSSASSSSIGHMLDCDPLKPNTGHLYVCQPHTIQIIQLVEAPPPPRRISSVIQSTSAGSSSASSYPSTSDSEEEDCSSYCSSIVTPDESSHDRDPIPWTDDTYSTRMKRVHAWRDGFVKATYPLAEARTSPLKRKSNPHQDDDTVRLTYFKTLTLARWPQHIQAHWTPMSRLRYTLPLASRVSANMAALQTYPKHVVSPSNTISNNPLHFVLLVSPHLTIMDTPFALLYDNPRLFRTCLPYTHFPSCVPQAGEVKGCIYRLYII
ncbi:hypothetical protein J3R83DRAFT_8130 [Lanmaoa asiatica]|nr:hypothetical protein J3R83DRAFT_8130 [Lanmaoa asiatica]